MPVRAGSVDDDYTAVDHGTAQPLHADHDMHHADPEARWAFWQRARQAGVLSPNDVRLEEG